MKRVLRADVPAESTALALALLAMRLVRVWPDGQVSGGRIVEVESYPPGDPSSHAVAGPRPRCLSMFLPHWYAYVYLIYGTYYCLNISSDSVDVGAAVLIRALEPDLGVAAMAERRGTTKLSELTRGPGRLTQALDIDRKLNGQDLDLSCELYLEPADPPRAIICGPRIGITKAADWPLRFYDPTSIYVSGSRKWNAAGRPLQSA